MQHQYGSNASLTSLVPVRFKTAESVQDSSDIVSGNNKSSKELQTHSRSSSSPPPPPPPAPPPPPQHPRRAETCHMSPQGHQIPGEAAAAAQVDTNSLNIALQRVCFQKEHPCVKNNNISKERKKSPSACARACTHTPARARKCRYSPGRTGAAAAQRESWCAVGVTSQQIEGERGAAERAALC